jgi:endo-1,4-beta-mannosidase
MKTIKFIFCCALVFVVSLQTMGQYVTLQGRQFKNTDGSDFYPLVCNYQVGLAVVGGNYFFTPNTNYGSQNWTDECGLSSPDCPHRIQADFHEIKKMGFNAIRLMGAQVVKDHFAWPSLINGTGADLSTNNYPNQFGISIRTVVPAPTTLYPNNDILLFTSPYASDANLQNYFTALDNVLSMANTEGLKVILVTCGGIYALSKSDVPLSGSSGSTIKDQNAHDFADMLVAFGNHFKNNTTIMAYDLWNEPATWVEPVSYVKVKQDVCNWTKTWYEALKDNACDPHHLITMGPWGDET